MPFPRSEQDPQRLRSVLFFDNPHLENSFEDNGVGQQVPDLLALEDDVFQRCLSAQPALHTAAEVQQGQVCSLLAQLPSYT